MKKLCVCLVILLAGVMSVFAGGGSQSTAPAAPADPNAPVTLTVWCWDPAFNIFSMNEAAKIYRKTRPNVTVNVVETPWNDLQQKLTTSLTARQTQNLPDIILMQDNAIEKFISSYQSAFLPVDGKIDTSQFAQYKVDTATINGKAYSVPFDNGASATFLRKDIIEQAGLKVSDFENITWDRFIELGKTVKAKTGIAMISAVGNQNDLVSTMLHSAGSWYFDKDGKVFLANNPVLKEAARVYKAMVDAGIIMLTSDWNAYIATLNSGTVASTVNGCWIIASISVEKSQADKWAMASTPRLNITQGTNYSNVGGSSWVVLANSKNPDVAFDFLGKTFGGSTELYDTILPTAGAIATWLPASKTAVYAQPNAFFSGQKLYLDLVDYAGKVPRVRKGVFNYEARDNVSLALVEITRGTAIDAALAKAQKDTEFLIGQ